MCLRRLGLTAVFALHRPRAPRLASVATRLPRVGWSRLGRLAVGCAYHPLALSASPRWAVGPIENLAVMRATPGHRRRKFKDVRRSSRISVPAQPEYARQRGGRNACVSAGSLVGWVVALFPHHPPARGPCARGRSGLAFPGVVGVRARDADAVGREFDRPHHRGEGHGLALGVSRRPAASRQPHRSGHLRLGMSRGQLQVLSMVC